VTRVAKGPKSVAKLMLLPLYVLSSLLSPLVPRTDRIWVFGRSGGIGGGPLAVLQYAQREDRGREYVWLVDRLDTSRDGGGPPGLRVVEKRSLRGYWCTQRARVAFTTHGLGDVNRLGVSGAFVVYLTHGAPWKKEFLDASVRPLVPPILRNPFGDVLYRQLQRLSRRQFNLIVVGSSYAAELIASAYKLPLSRIAVTGVPEADYLVQAAQSGHNPTALTPRQVLYAPTWRDGSNDPAVPTEEDWLRIRSVLLAHNAYLCIRSHPHGGSDYRRYLRLEDHQRWLRFSSPSVEHDVTRLLPRVDVLITDYSAIAMEFSLLRRPILFFAPDLEDYLAARGLYGDYRQLTGGEPAKTWADVSTRLDLILSNGGMRDRNLKVVDQIRARYHSYLDDRSAERVYRRVLQEISS
jgi:CDP-glycerol glycerophosphotransferase (TagB/SpsB family)